MVGVNGWLHSPVFCTHAFVHALTVQMVCFLMQLGWDSDLAATLLLVHLLPPTAKGKRHRKMNAPDAADHIIKLMKVCFWNKLINVLPHLLLVAQSFEKKTGNVELVIIYAIMWCLLWIQCVCLFIYLGDQMVEVNCQGKYSPYNFLWGNKHNFFLVFCLSIVGGDKYGDIPWQIWICTTLCPLHWRKEEQYSEILHHPGPEAHSLCGTDCCGCLQWTV